MYYLIIKNGIVIDRCQLKSADSETISLEVTEEVYNNSKNYGLNYYIYQNNELVVNPNYEVEEAKKLKQKRIEEIKEELNELDLKSIRSIRANETDRIAQYEQQAQELRYELNQLIEELEE